MHTGGPGKKAVSVEQEDQRYATARLGFGDRGVQLATPRQRPQELLLAGQNSNDRKYAVSGPANKDPTRPPGSPGRRLIGASGSHFRLQLPVTPRRGDSNREPLAFCGRRVDMPRGSNRWGGAGRARSACRAHNACSARR